MKSHNFKPSIGFKRVLLLVIAILCCIFLPCSAATTPDSTDDSTMPADSTNNKSAETTTLVVGATGATGKWVVKLLLDQGQRVKVIVRSQERMMKLLQEINGDTASYGDRLSIVESPLLDMTDAELQDQVRDCQTVISCLGHNMDFKGLFGHPRRLVTDSVKRLTTAMKQTTSSSSSTKKFILMGSEGVANPNGKDDKRPFAERAVLCLLRYLVPPHADNEDAAAYVHSLGELSSLEWLVIRPTDLIDGEPDGKIKLFDKPVGSLFSDPSTATRANVAKSMADFALDDKQWNQWKFQMPVIHDQGKVGGDGKSEL